MKEITVTELKKMQDNKESFVFIDVREPDEYEHCNLGATNIPQGEAANTPEEFEADKDTKVVVHCRSGKRSTGVITYLEDMFDYPNLYNLKGGILAYKAEIDPSLTVE